MMNHDGWMWMGGWGMWLWPVFGVAVVALLVILIMKVSKRQNARRVSGEKTLGQSGG